MQKLISLGYEPASELLHSFVKKLSLIESCTDRYSSEFKKSPSDTSWLVQGYLAHKKQPRPPRTSIGP